MTDMRRVISLASLAAAAFLAGCDDGLIRPAASGAPASVAIAPSLDLSVGGVNEAYLKVNQLAVRFLVGNDLRLAQTVPFDPNASETVVSLQVPLNEAAETFTVQLDLLASNQKLFTGSGTAQLTSGRAKEVEIPIVPVVTLTCSGAPFVIGVYQAARQLPGGAVFASGDTMPVAWSTSNATIVTVDQVGRATGLQDGTAQVTCSAQGQSASRQVQVLAAVASVAVNPVTDTVLSGSTVSFAAILKDSLAHAITAPRTVSWSSSNNAVATVSAAGVATGVAPGTATITATSGGASGSAALLVVSPPTVRTISGVPVASGATLSGGVNPQGLPTAAWFEWGTSPTLAGAQRTPNQNLAAGRTELPTSGSLSNLTGLVTYYFRAAASNAAGTSYGQILSFVANGPPVVTSLPAAVAGTTATLNATVNPSGTATSARFEWGTSPTLTGPTYTAWQNIGSGSTVVSVQADVTGLAAGVTYYFRITATNQIGSSTGTILSFAVPRAPGVATLMPTGITSNAATLQASINPNGAATTAWFEWWLVDTTTGGSTTERALTGTTGTLSFAELLSGLQAGRRYQYRAWARNSVGTTSGNWVDLQTGVLARGDSSTWTPGPVGTTFYWITTLYGTAYPNGVATQAWFEFAVDAGFGQIIATTAAVNVGSGSTRVIYSGTVSPVSNCGPYYYRVVATNRYGTYYGPARSTYCEGGGVPQP